MPICPFCELPLTKPVERCPSCHGDLTNAPSTPAPVRRSGGTLIESPGTFPSAESGPHTASDQRRQPGAATTETDRRARHTARVKPQRTAATDAAVPYCPVNCPPVLNLCLLDAGSREDGEWFRLRDRRFVIGRSEGDLVLPHDEGLSGRHAEIVRRTHKDGYRFVLVDLQSTNGTFVRVSRLLLRAGQELLIGGRRFQFDAGTDSDSPPKSAEELDDGTPDATISWQRMATGPADSSVPSLVELAPGGGNVQRIPLDPVATRIGCDPSQCNAVISGDPFVSSLHATVTPGRQNRWQIENMNSLNGLWLRVSEMPLDGNAEFQLGEQRFLVRPQRSSLKSFS